MGIVEAVPGRAHHVDHVSMDRREAGEAPGGDAQHAEVVVQRRGAVFDLDALLFPIHRATFLLWCWSKRNKLKSCPGSRRLAMLAN